LSQIANIIQVIDFTVTNGVLSEVIEEKDQKIHYYKFTALCTDIQPTSKEANPRKQDISKKNKVASKIRETLLNPDISFHTRNKGITYFADSLEVEYNNNGTCTVRILFTDPTSQGSVDGGHTEMVILDEAGNYPEWKKVNIEVMTGINSPFTHVSVAESRNTGASVTAETLDELSGMHEILKDHLKETPFEDRVSFKQNEDKEDGKDLTITLIKKLYETFNIRDFADKDPKGVYSSNQGVISKYRKEYDAHGTSTDNVYEKLKYVSADIFKLTNLIHKNFKDLYNRYGKGNYLANKCADYKDGSRKELVLFGDSEQYLDYKVPNGLLFLALSGFRQFLTENDKGYYEWKFNIFENDKLKGLLEVVFQVLASGMRDNDNNPQSVGKNAMVWQVMRTQVFMKAYMNHWVK
jgi:hypothetical protein